VWVTDWGGGLYSVGEDGSVGRELALGQEAHHLAFSDDSAELWVTDSPGRSVSVVDVRRQELLGRVDLPGAPHHVAVVGDRVAIADNTNGRLVVVDRRARQVVAQVDVGAAPHGVAPTTPDPPP
jgi:DNA-binding beta-propeller fold protein YncE